MRFYGENSKKFNDPLDPNTTMISSFQRKCGKVNGLDSEKDLEEIRKKFYPDGIPDDVFDDFTDFLCGFDPEFYTEDVGDASNCKDIMLDYDELKNDNGNTTYGYKMAEAVIDVLRQVKMSDMTDNQKEALDWALDFRDKYFNDIDNKVKETIERDIWWEPRQFYPIYNVGYDMASAYARYLKNRRIEDVKYKSAMQVIDKANGLPEDMMSDSVKDSLNDAHEYCRFYFYINIPSRARDLIEIETSKRIEDRHYSTGEIAEFNIDREMVSKYAKYCELTGGISNNLDNKNSMKIKK